MSRRKVAAVAAATTALLLAGVGVSAADTAPGYTLETDASGSIIRWDPCSPIHYRVNTGNAGARAAADVETAIGYLRNDSGLNLVYDGTTSDVPQSTYGRNQPPGRNGPLEIAFADPSQTDLLPSSSNSAGEGGIVYASSSNAPTQVVAGYVIVNTAAGLEPGFGSGRNTSEGRVLLHELGHAVALDHTQDPNQVMYSIVDGRATSDYADGDKAGLSRLGAHAGCIAGGPTSASVSPSTPPSVSAPPKSVSAPPSIHILVAPQGDQIAPPVAGAEPTEQDVFTRWLSTLIGFLPAFLRSVGL